MPVEQKSKIEDPMFTSSNYGGSVLCRLRLLRILVSASKNRKLRGVGTLVFSGQKKDVLKILEDAKSSRVITKMEGLLCLSSTIVIQEKKERD